MYVSIFSLNRNCGAVAPGATYSSRFSVLPESAFSEKSSGMISA